MYVHTCIPYVHTCIPYVHTDMPYVHTCMYIFCSHKPSSLVSAKVEISLFYHMYAAAVS